MIVRQPRMRVVRLLLRTYIDDVYATMSLNNNILMLHNYEVLSSSRTTLILGCLTIIFQYHLLLIHDHHLLQLFLRLETLTLTLTIILLLFTEVEEPGSQVIVIVIALIMLHSLRPLRLETPISHSQPPFLNSNQFLVTSVDHFTDVCQEMFFRDGA